MTIRRSSGQLPWWFPIPFALGGIAVLAMGVVLLLDEVRFGNEGVSVTATVVDSVYSPGGSDTGPSYTLRYEYVDPITGRGHAGQGDVSEQQFDQTSIGQAIEVTYLPAEPDKSRIGSPEPQLFIPFAVMGGGTLFLVVGVGLALLVVRIRRHGVPSWVSVSSGTLEAEPDDDDVSTAISNLFSDESSEHAPKEATGATKEAPLTEAELRALDARLAPDRAD